MSKLTPRADSAKANAKSVSCLAIDKLRDDIAHEISLVAWIDAAVADAEQGNFATPEQVAAIRARRWSRNAD